MKQKDRIPDLTIWLFGSLIIWLVAIWVALLIGTNTSSFVLYAIDKMQAQARRSRIPEKTLYLSAFFGGSIGALLAMHLFRHKTKKLSFQLVLALLILIEVGFVYWMTTGQSLLQFL